MVTLAKRAQPHGPGSQLPQAGRRIGVPMEKQREGLWASQACSGMAPEGGWKHVGGGRGCWLSHDCWGWGENWHLMAECWAQAPQKIVLPSMPVKLS